MDFQSAALLVTAVFTITQLIKRLLPTLSPAWTQLTVLLVGVAVTFLDAYSTYGSSQTVNGVALNNVNVAGLILIGLLIGGGATAFHTVFGTAGAVANIGFNRYKGERPSVTAQAVVASSDLQVEALEALKDRLASVSADLGTLSSAVREASAQ
jgi:hypothetical protein